LGTNSVQIVSILVNREDSLQNVLTPTLESRAQSTADGGIPERVHQAGVIRLQQEAHPSSLQPQPSDPLSPPPLTRIGGADYRLGRRAPVFDLNRAERTSDFPIMGYASMRINRVVARRTLSNEMTEPRAACTRQFAEVMKVVKQELLTNGIYDAETIASMMGDNRGDSYTAMIEHSILKMVEQATYDSEKKSLSFKNGAGEIVTIKFDPDKKKPSLASVYDEMKSAFDTIQGLSDIQKEVLKIALNNKAETAKITDEAVKKARNAIAGAKCVVDRVFMNTKGFEQVVNWPEIFDDGKPVVVAVTQPVSAISL
ncbi:MAG: hypothetical protein JWO53_991, partial [Chlamydiia bacterium]|nr:hypothetical protein [Chlamydiia bacterium]